MSFSGETCDVIRETERKKEKEGREKEKEKERARERRWTGTGGEMERRGYVGGGCVRKWWRSECGNGTGIEGSMLDSGGLVYPSPLLSGPASRAATDAARPFASFFLLGSGTVIKTRVARAEFRHRV